MSAVLLLCCCSTRGLDDYAYLDYDYGRELTHGEIVLGDRLENPYTTENMRDAFESLYPTKARQEIQTTNLYVRFLPSGQEDFDALAAKDVHLTDHPLDFEIVQEGDWYHDPDIPEGECTWQYAVVPVDFDFKGFEYEIIDEIFISENKVATRSDDVDWEALEREAYRMTGNSSRLSPLTKSGPARPTGRITIIDSDWSGGKPVGVSGVKVVCNSFVKFSTCYTDRDGYYSMPKEFTSDVRYNLLFKNEKGFGIGFNAILVPASVSTLGKSSPTGVNLTVTSESEQKLFTRCVVNNAVYDYFNRCKDSDFKICPPPLDLRLWIFYNLSASSAVMMHQGTVVSETHISEFLGSYAGLVKLFAPDITIGTKGRSSYPEIYKTVIHELAHASHYAQVGNDYWNNYIWYILESFIMTGGMTYGKGEGDKAGYCEIGEMWAYYLESKLYQERYGGIRQSFGTSYWFYPQIFRTLEERGLPADDIFAALEADVTSRDDLLYKMENLYPYKRTVISQVFSRYE